MIAASAALAGWSEDFQLTHRGYEIEPQVIARNDTVHVAWQEVAGPMRISYIRSIDVGNDWNNIIDLIGSGHRGIFPIISFNEGKVFVAWSDLDMQPMDPVHNIGYSYSSDGEIWHGPSYVFPRWSLIGYNAFSSALSGDSIYVTYLPWIVDSSGNELIFFNYSPDLGNSWSDSQVVGRTYEYLNGLKMKQCGGSIYIVWSAVGINAFDVFAAISHDGGITWDEPRQLSSDIMDAQLPCIACDGGNGNVAVGWVDSQESHSFPGDLYLRVTPDGGYSWGNELHATHHHKVASPSLAYIGDSLWAVWSDEDIAHWGTLNYEICFTKSTDMGQSWTPYERLTNAQGLSQSPWISHDNGELHVVWYEEHRPPDSTGDEIYYKRYEPDVGIGDDGRNRLPSTITLADYPNPFNSSVIITYSDLKGGEIDIMILKGN